MALNKEDRSFKILINKRASTDPDDGGRQFFQEDGADTINIHVREVWADTLSSDSASMVASGTVEEFDLFMLTPDPVFSASAWFFQSGSGFQPGTSSYNADSQSTDFVPDKFGANYEARLYDNDHSQIFTTDAINWIFDYKTGILHIADPGTYSTPYKIGVVKYIGKTLEDTGSIPAANITGSVSSASFALTASFVENAGFWTESGVAVSRFSDVLISGSLFVSSSISGTELNWDGAAETLTSFSSSAEGRVTTLEAEPHWTSSGTGVSRFSDVLISGSLLVSSSISGTEINWDGASETLTSFSSSTSTRITTLEASPGLWTASGDFIRRQSDVEITGTLYVSGNIEITSSATVDGVDISEFSSSAETRIVALEASNAVSGAFWTSSGDFIRRQSDVEITGALRISGDVTGSGFTGSFTGDGSGLSGIPGASALWTESGDFIRRQSDVHVSGTLYVSGNIELTSSATVDGVDISSFSSSVATEIDELEVTTSTHETRLDNIDTSGSTGFGHWTASGNFIRRQSDIEITGSVSVFNSVNISGTSSLNTLSFPGYVNYSDANGQMFSNQGAGNVWSYFGQSTGSWFVRTSGSNRLTVDGPTGNVLVAGNLSASVINYDGSAETLTSFSSSTSTRITTLEGNPASFWTASGDFIRRQSDVEITGTLYVSGNIELTSSATVDGVDISEFSASVATEVDGLQTDSASFSTRVTDEEATSSDHETRVTTLEAEPHWTASGTGVSRFSDVTVSGSLFVSSSISGTELNWDGASETLTSFSSSAAGRITTLETTPAGLWTASGDFIRRQSDVEISGTLYVSGNIELTSSATVDGVDISEFSASVATEVDGLQTDSASFSTRVTDEEATSSDHETRVTTLEAEPHWTASGTGISRFSDVTVSGSLLVSSSISGTELNWDGASETLTSFSSSAASRITTLEGNPASFWTASGDFIRRQSDVQITGSLRVSQTGSFLHVTSSEIEVDDLRIHGTSTNDVLYQSGSNGASFIGEPTASVAVLHFTESRYVWLDEIDGGIF